MRLCTYISNFIKSTLLELKIQICNNPVIVDDFNTPLSLIDHLDKSRQALELNDIIHEMDQADRNKISTQTPKNIYSTNSLGMSLKMDYILEHKTSLNKFITLQ